MSELLAFPNPVNEKAARFVAGVVVLLSVVTLATSGYWLLAVIAYGFVARVLTGPTLSPLGRFAMNVAAPRLGPAKLVPGPPKRFAQGMGATMTVAASVLALGFGQTAIADGLLVMMIVAAVLESCFAICLGCHVFSLLIRVGLVPAAVCADCADIWARPDERAVPTS